MGFGGEGGEGATPQLHHSSQTSIVSFGDTNINVGNNLELTNAEILLQTYGSRQSGENVGGESQTGHYESGTAIISQLLVIYVGPTGYYQSGTGYFDEYTEMYIQVTPGMYVQVTPGMYVEDTPGMYVQVSPGEYVIDTYYSAGTYVITDPGTPAVSFGGEGHVSTVTTNNLISNNGHVVK